MTNFAMLALIVAVIACFLLAHAIRNNPYTAAEVEPGPLEGLDYQVRRSIEAGDSDAMIIRYAENVAVGEWNANHPHEEWAEPHQLPVRLPLVPPKTVAIPHSTMSIPYHYTHVVGHEPTPVRVRFTDTGVVDCDDCDFEELSMFGGEVVRKIRTVACPSHAHPPPFTARYDNSEE